MDQLWLLLDEIASLGVMRLQGLWGLLHTLVLELYAHGHGRLYLVCDYSLKAESFHLQNQKPGGEKVVTPLILALRKHALHRGISFMRIEYQPLMLRANIISQEQDISLMFELSKPFKIGLYSGSRLLVSARPGHAPALEHACLPALSFSSLALNFAQAERYRTNKDEQLRSGHVQSRRQSLSLELRKKLSLLKNLNADLKKCELNLSYEHDAELIKAHLPQLKKGMTKATLTDYSQTPPQQKLVLLDKILSPQQYLEKIFHQIKRARRGLSHIKPRITLVEAEIDALKQALMQVDAGNLSDKEAQNPHQVEASKAKLKAQKRLPYRVFMSSDQIPLWVGRSAKDNDALTLHHSRGKEWWFHVRDGAGSHVLVKSSSDALPPDTVLEAAMLAAHFSSHKNDPSPEICYTRVKNIRKPKGLPPGKVLIEQEKGIVVRMDQARLAKLCS